MTASVIFCLSYDLSKELIIAFKVGIISTKVHCCHRRRRDHDGVTFSRESVNTLRTLSTE